MFLVFLNMQGNGTNLTMKLQTVRNAVYKIKIFYSPHFLNSSKLWFFAFNKKNSLKCTVICKLKKFRKKTNNWNWWFKVYSIQQDWKIFCIGLSRCLLCVMEIRDLWLVREMNTKMQFVWYWQYWQETGWRGCISTCIMHHASTI